MLYYLFEWLDKAYNVPGVGVIKYISFRSACCFVSSLLIMLLCGKPFIRWIGNRLHMNDVVRTELGLEGAAAKSKTPTMGGLLIIAAIVLPTLLFTKLDNIYILTMLGTTLWLGFIGFLDDYMKKTVSKKGLAGKYKVIGQVVLGLVVGLLIVTHPDIATKTTDTDIATAKTTNTDIATTKTTIPDIATTETTHLDIVTIQNTNSDSDTNKIQFSTPKTTIPFVKNNEFDYAWLVSWMGDWARQWSWIVYVIVAILVVTAVSNAANLTDGIDGLASGVGATIGGALAILAWLSGNIIMAKYLNITYLENIGELTMFIASFVGALLGFLWFNSHPAQIFMGDTGSLTIGGVVAVFALLIHKELLLPLLCGIYLVEDLSVIHQTAFCKIYRKRHRLAPNEIVPVEKRPYRMTPLHHHFQKQGQAEEKVVQRFIIVSVLLAIVSIVTLKLR